jgi:BsuBI/PstI restriction endonuclease domain
VIALSPGGQNVLIKEIVNEFAPRFTSPGRFSYVGDTDDKFACFDRERRDKVRGPLFRSGAAGRVASR